MPCWSTSYRHDTQRYETCCTPTCFLVVLSTALRAGFAVRYAVPRRRGNLKPTGTGWGVVSLAEVPTCRRIVGGSIARLSRPHRGLIGLHPDPGAGCIHPPPPETVAVESTGDQHTPEPQRPDRRSLHCLVHFKIARDARRLLEFAILVWTIPAPVVQIHIAIPATGASGRVERLQHSANSLKRAQQGLRGAA